MKEKEPLVYIVILNYNNLKNSIDCINDLREIQYKNYRIILVDNCSTDNSESVLREMYPDITIIQTFKNKGYAAGNNEGIKYSLKNGADYILIINNDIVVNPDFLNKLVETAQSDEKIGIVGPKVLTKTGDIQWSCARNEMEFKDKLFSYTFLRDIFKNNKYFKNHIYSDYKFDKIKNVFAIAGCCMLIKRKVFESTGLLDENTFLYEEELILAKKVKESGLITCVNPDSQIIHFEGQSTKNLKAFSKIAFIHSEIYYCRKYLKMKEFNINIIKMIRFIEYFTKVFSNGDYRKHLPDLFKAIKE